MSKSSRAFIAFVVILALCVSVSVLAATAPKSNNSVITGAGPGLGSATASNTTDTAWIYTGEFSTTTPAQITGGIRMSARRAARITEDRATVNSEFNWDGAAYRVSVDCLFPIAGQNFPGHGPVQFNRPVLGAADIGTLGVPETHAHVAVYGRAAISRDGTVIAENQPAIVMVNQALHDSNQAWLSSPDATRNELTLIVPGPLNGQKFVKGFPNGYFYVYWPNGTLNMTGDTSPKPMPESIPTRVGRGPATPMLGTETPRGTINVSLTSTGIRKTIGEAPTGLYDLRITNSSNRTRGLVISGIDLCCTPYTRFSRLLRPGQSQVFRWYFAPGKVQFRDFTGGARTATSWTNVRYGGHASSLVFTEVQ